MGKLNERRCTHCSHLEDAISVGVCSVTPHKVVTTEDDNVAVTCLAYENRWGLEESPSKQNAKNKEEIMEELQKAIQLAIEEFKKEFGPDAKIEDGDTFATVFNNCVLVISLENGEFKTEFIGGKPYRVDMTLSIYGNEEENKEEQQ